MSWYNWLKELFSGNGGDNTTEGSVIRTGGKIASKTITLNANNTTANVNVFQFTGTVKVLSLHGRIKTATTLTNLTAAYFNVWDGTAQRDITLNTGVAMSGFGVGAFFAKLFRATIALTAQDNNAANYVEDGGSKNLYQQFMIVQKIATASYIRFTYTTTDAPINAELEIFIEYVDDDYSSVTPV